MNDTVLLATSTPPVFSSGWRHVALTYQQPYTMLCQGGGFEVKKGDNFNFSRDFSVAMTFSVSDITTEQGLLYKGTGSDNTAPELAMSYRVGVSGGHVTLQFFDAGDKESPLFIGPPITANQFYQLIVVKKADHTLAGADSADPYPSPFDTSDLGTISDQGMGGNASGLQSDSGDITISKIAPAGTSGNTRTLKFLDGIKGGTPKSYDVTMSVREVLSDGTFSPPDWTTVATSQTVADDSGLAIKQTGTSHLLIGAAFADDGTSRALGRAAGEVGNIRNVYVFNSGINRDGIRRDDGTTVESRRPRPTTR